jgi:hypothetical protein
LVGVRKDIDLKYEYPKPHNKIYNLKDALKKVNFTIQMFQSQMVQNTHKAKKLF